MKRVLASCMIGNIIEWYDFVIYALFASTIGQLFFPESSPSTQMINSFAIYAVGFVARPLGAIFFGHIGDKKSRKTSLMWSIYVMAIPTALIGCLPTYQQVGMLAPVLLTVLRILQGFAIGGEFTGSMVFMVESAPLEKRGFYGSWASCSAVIGAIIGSSMAYAFSLTFTPEEMLAHGWRWPFIISIVGSFLGSYIRRSLTDPENFKKKKNKALPLQILFQHHLGEMSLVFFIDIVTAIGFFILVTFLPSFFQSPKYLNLAQPISFKINTINLIVFATFSVLGGWWSDIKTRRRILMIGSLGLAFVAWPVFYLMTTKSILNVFIAQCCMAVFMGLFFGTIPAALSEIFPTEVRFSGLSLAHNMSMTVFGGTAPWLSSLLIERTNNLTAPSFILMGAGLLTFIALLFYKNHCKYREEATYHAPPEDPLEWKKSLPL